MGKYEIKEKLDNLVYKIYNALANIKFQFSDDKKLVAENIKFKDIHMGERCFILGTGPSLKELNYNLLKDEICFGLNYLYKGDIIEHIKPKYYCIYDEIMFENRINDTFELFKKLPESTYFLRTNAKKVLKKDMIESNQIYYQACKTFQFGDLIKIDLTKSVTAPYNVVLGCIQTAIYMGFKEIYLLGCDFNSFATPLVHHFYDKNKNDLIKNTMPLGWYLKYYSLVSYHHYALEKYSRNKGIRIINLTPDSLLDAYKSKDIIDIVGKKI